MLGDALGKASALVCRQFGFGIAAHHRHGVVMLRRAPARLYQCFAAQLGDGVAAPAVIAPHRAQVIRQRTGGQQAQQTQQPPGIGVFQLLPRQIERNDLAGIAV